MQACRPLWRFGPFQSNLAVAALFLMMADPRSVHALEVTCARADVHIHLEEAGSTGLICGAAEQAIRFMASIGLRQEATIQINVVSTIPGGYDDAMGCYDWSHKSVSCRGSEAFLGSADRPRPFGIEMNESIYKSFVAHEVAHAVAAASFDYKTPSVAAQEYIAAVVQFSVMAARPREAILSRFEGDGFDAPSEINLLAYQVDPARFAVEVHRHFMKPGNGRDFVHALLSGSVKLRDYSISLLINRRSRTAHSASAG